MVSGSGSLNSSAANASRALSSKVASQSYNLRAEANSQRQATVAQNNQLDPSVLARIALEEELKKKGGGGGGGGKSYNPLAWVPYSFTLMAKAIDQARQVVADAFLQALDTINQTIQGGLAQFGQNLTNLFRPITQPINTAFANIGQSLAKALSQFAKNPIAFAGRMANNAMQTGMAIFAAVVNGLKKIIYGKDEAKNDVDEEEYKEEGVLSRLLSFMNFGDNDNEGNGKNIRSHLNNQAKQITQRKKKQDYAVN